MERNNVVLTSLGFEAMPIAPVPVRSAEAMPSDDEDYTPRADETDVPNPPRKRKKQATKQNGRSRTCTLLFEPIAIINILSYPNNRRKCQESQTYNCK